MPIRYMGTKRHIAHRVRRIVQEFEPRGRVVDLFSGMGCVAAELAGVSSVVTNDALAFTGALARARFTDDSRQLAVSDVLARLRDPYREHVERLSAVHRVQLRREQRVLSLGRVALGEYMATAQHAANSESVARKARSASRATEADRYCLATLYFAAGYFGLRQAIQVDALRYAIDQADELDGDRDWLLGAWIGAAATVINAPGHTAQFLKPNTEQGYRRIRRSWQRSIWEEFQNRLIELKPVGTRTWRRHNAVKISDALDLLADEELRGVGIVYADPPYTKDQYSRYYHVYETLYLYDFPGAVGQGRVRPDRFTTGFSLKSGVEQAFTDLFEAMARLEVPLVLSYPSDGLLAQTGRSVPSIARGHLALAAKESFAAEHSTLGASKGSTTKKATENLYVYRPA